MTASVTPTFKESYCSLQKNTATLRNRADPNIDDPFTIVTESVSAYEVCENRIDAVEKALEEALTDSTVAVKQS